MAELVFATNNNHKLFEIREILGESFKILGLEEIGIREDIPEDHFTLEENALQKAEYIHNKLGYSCFADDTGLEIEALGGEPGVFSARYSRMGEPVYPDMDVAKGNIRKVLEKMEPETKRNAKFRTVIALIIDNERYFFEGEVTGTISLTAAGEEGFGYDPIFIPDGYDYTFAEMDIAEKNRISHRANAVQKLSDFLQSYDVNQLSV